MSDPSAVGQDRPWVRRCHRWLHLHIFLKNIFLVCFGYGVLHYIFTQKEPNLRQSRWLELLKDNDMSILYHLGKANFDGDFDQVFYM